MKVFTFDGVLFVFVELIRYTAIVALFALCMIQGTIPTQTYTNGGHGGHARTTQTTQATTRWATWPVTNRSLTMCGYKVIVYTPKKK
jgi:hypothetical protein